MNKRSRFQCKWDSPETLPEERLKKSGISLWEAQTQGESMAVAAVAKKEEEHDSLCRIPFCVTVEAEAFGAWPSGSDPEGSDPEGSDPEGSDKPYRFSTLAEVAGMGELDFSSGTISEVLRCAEILTAAGEAVAVNVEGPFTILGLLLDPVQLYKGIYLEPEHLKVALTVIEDNLVRYMEALVDKGVKVISYADPTGARELLGGALFREWSGKSSYRILKRIEPVLKGTLLHICGVTSLSLEEEGFCKAQAVKIEQVRTYGESLCVVQQQHPEVRLAGHHCMKCTPAVMAQPVVWQIKLQ